MLRLPQTAYFPHEPPLPAFLPYIGHE